MQQTLQKVARIFSRTPQTKQVSIGASNTFMVQAGQPVWMRRDYTRFAEEGYRRNVIAYRAISMIASAAASIPWKLFDVQNNVAQELQSHPLKSLLNQPAPMTGGSEFFENLYTTRLLSGNAFIQAVGPKNAAPRELYMLRPDRITIIAGKGALPQAYRYQLGQEAIDFPVDRITGASRILHLKSRSD